MAASGFTLEAVRNFIVQRGNKVTNHELVTRFKSDLNDPQFKGKNRENFKDFVNTLATIKVDERGEKVLVLKKKFRSDTTEQGQKLNDSQDPRNDIRASSEPPTNPGGSDQVDGGGMSKVRSETNITSRETTPDMSMTGSASMGTISMSSAASSSVSQGSQQSIASSADLEDDVNASVISVKDRAKHLNRMETESELQRVSHPKKKDIRSRDRERDVDDDSHSYGSAYTSLEPHEREWLVVSASGDYHPMHKLLSKNPDLVRVRDFTNTAVHWAAKHGKSEVVKLVLSKGSTDVNRRTTAQNKIDISNKYPSKGTWNERAKSSV
ncbi:ankyrin repeat domain-containing protein SOWAHC-like [Mizuhopecten yessoensis]|uniref:ankyrin repeat domain-containing protein SOWAHC-like n=1 Tax=Mizuhopecten yessoensis TaxID=6573 RepID=UPI000B45B7F4|nr:ankyrin repeat domain-containing protein SOWAHC-like [Mizuhopecten yessoensis]